MADSNAWVPPKVWKWDMESGGAWAGVNRPIAGPTHEKELTVGNHPWQLYSQGTPNGVKVTILLEELLAMGEKGAEYDAWLIKITGDQFGSGFVSINPNSKIPAMLDMSTSPPTRIFESGAILVYVADKFGAFIPPVGDAARAECLSWLMWQMGSTPYLGGGFGHFYTYAPEKLEYPINRYAMEVKRQLDVLDQNLAERQYLCGDDYNIADMAVYAWYGQMVLTGFYDSMEFLEVPSYTNVVRWASEIHQRPAVRRGRKVNRESDSGLAERHDERDWEALGL
ncbi:MAG: glutathione-dependent disulfide-bond oxidoreductase [Gammaproteobacteria bacterium]|nr:glutathione-dependent disulfide-bond oxidoreductase [Gammaproteobacteria bacterium]